MTVMWRGCELAAALKRLQRLSLDTRYDREAVLLDTV